MSNTTGDPFAAFIESLRNDYAGIDKVSYRDIAYLLRDALALITPDDDRDAQAAESLHDIFESIAESYPKGVEPDAEPDIDELRAFGYDVHHGDEGSAERRGRWWWTLTRDGWSGIEVGDDVATKDEAWRDAARHRYEV